MKNLSKLTKRILCFSLAVLLSLGVFAGCGAGTSGEQSPATDPKNTDTSTDSGTNPATTVETVEIDFWHHYPSGEGAELMTALINEFMEENPHIKVNELGLGLGEQGEKLVPALAAGTAPDIMVYDLSTVKERAMKGQTMSLNEFVEAANLDMSVFFPDTVEACTYEGELYGLPFITDTRVLFYNKDHFRAAGLDPEVAPKSWDELLEYAEKLTILGDDGKATQVGMSLNVFEIAPWTMGWSFGANIWNEDGTPNVNSAEMQSALEYVLKLQETVGLDNYNALNEAAGSTGVHAFVNGTISMCVQFNGFYNTIETYNPDMDFGVALIPSHDGVNDHASWGAGYSLEFCYKGDDARAQAAFELGKFLCSDEVASRFILTTSDFVCNMNAYQHPDVQADPVWQCFLESGKVTKMHYFCPALPTWHWGTLLPEWQAATIGNKTPEQALADAQKNIEQEILNYNLMNG